MISIFSVTLVVLYGQTRILFAMGRDGLLPPLFAKVHPRTKTPVNNTIIVAAVVSILAGFVPLGYLADMRVSIGTLVAFIVVSVGVIILRVREPDLPRGFTVPLYPVTPVLSVLACGYICSACTGTPGWHSPAGSSWCWCSTSPGAAASSALKGGGEDVISSAAADSGDSGVPARRHH